MADTKLMASANRVGLSWSGVLAAVTHAVHLLETQGAACADVVKVIMVGVEAVRAGNYLGIYAALNQATVDVQEIVAAIRTEFELN